MRVSNLHLQFAYKIYSALLLNCVEDYSDGYEQVERRRITRIHKLIEGYTSQDVDKLMQICLESKQSFDKYENNLSLGLGYVFESLATQEKLYLYLVDAYLKANTPYKISAEPIIAKLFKIMSVSDLKKLITKYTYTAQNVWLWYFYALMPEQYITAQLAADLLCYLDMPDVEMHSSPHRRMDLLRKYEIVEPQIVVKSLRIILSHYEESPFIFSLYVSCILNQRNEQEAEAILRSFGHELSLLEEIYLKGISCSDFEDGNGILLYAIISADAKFLYKYLDYLIAIQMDYKRVRNHYDILRLLKIWDTEQYMELAYDVFNYLCEKKEKSPYRLYHSPLKMMLSSEADHQEIVAKQDRWIEYMIEQYSQDRAKMYELFSAIEEFPGERRKKAVVRFLSLNNDPDAFEQLPLEPSHWGGCGSMIPYMQKRIDYLHSLLPFVSGIKYLKQKQRIEREIEGWKARIHSEEIRELLEYWYR